MVIGVREVEEQLLNFVEDFLSTGVTAINLVDHQDDRQILGQGLRQHVSSLRQGTFCSIHEKQDSVDQCKCSLHFPAEVSVTWSIDQVDLHTLPLDLGRLGKNGDPTLTFLVVVVHDTVDDRRMAGEGSSAPQEGVDERRLTVVDVGDERNAPQFLRGCSHGSFRCRPTYWSSSASSSSSSSNRTP